MFIFPCPHILATTSHRFCASSNSIIDLPDRSLLRQVLRSQPLQHRPWPEPRPYAPSGVHPSPTPSVPSNARNWTHRYSVYALFAANFVILEQEIDVLLIFWCSFNFLGISENSEISQILTEPYFHRFCCHFFPSLLDSSSDTSNFSLPKLCW